MGSNQFEGASKRNNQFNLYLIRNADLLQKNKKQDSSKFFIFIDPPIMYFSNDPYEVIKR